MKNPQYNHIMSWLTKEEAENLLAALKEKFPNFNKEFELKIQDQDNPNDCPWHVITLWARNKTKDVLIPAAWAEGWVARGRA